jgi:hypothetical protein
LKKEGKLVAVVPGQGTAELHPLATNRFFIEQINGERTALTPWEPADLQQYQGVYWSDELEAQYTITFQDAKLTANHIRHGIIEQVPAGQDRFTTTYWLMPEAHFLRDASNCVSGLTVAGGRVTAIRFKR